MMAIADCNVERSIARSQPPAASTTRSMDSTADVAIASFYPNLCSVIKVRVHGAEAPIYCCHDLGAYNDEIRHFMDENYLREVVPGGRDLKIVDPSPPCTTLGMTKTPNGEPVVGMLEKRLSVAGFKPTTKSWLEIKLSNVLVVRNLPVPLCISTKNLVHEATSQAEKTAICALQQYTFPSASLFPERYRSHVYWNKDEEVFFLGSVGNEEDGTYFQRTQTIRDSATGRPNQIMTTTSKVCAHCGQKMPALRCSRCKRVSYCSADCQKSHWTDH